MAHGDCGRPAPVAVPLAPHAITVPVSDPDAVPAYATPPQLALKYPFAVVPVCSVAFHLKSLQVDGDGITPVALLTDCQLPIRAWTPLVGVVGAVLLDLCSNPTHPTAAIDTAAADTSMYFFIAFFIGRRRAVGY